MILQKKIVTAQNELESNIFSLQQNINVIKNPDLQKQITDFVTDLESWMLTNPRNLSLSNKNSKRLILSEQSTTYENKRWILIFV